MGACLPHLAGKKNTLSNFVCCPIQLPARVWTLAFSWITVAKQGPCGVGEVRLRHVEAVGHWVMWYASCLIWIPCGTHFYVWLDWPQNCIGRKWIPPLLVFEPWPLFWYASTLTSVLPGLWNKKNTGNCSEQDKQKPLSLTSLCSHTDFLWMLIV